jgi:hypothetical protein
VGATIASGDVPEKEIAARRAFVGEHTLGEDAAGELYLLTTAQGIPAGRTGKVWKLVPAEAR